MKPILPMLVALLALAAPAVATPEGYIDPRWDKDLAKALGKLKVGMDANQAENVFAAMEPKKLMDSVDYRSKIIQEFHLTSTKQRVYLNANFYQLGNTQTRHKAMLVFQAPVNEYRGAAAKLVRWGLVDHYKYDQWAKVPVIDVAGMADVSKRQLFKF